VEWGGVGQRGREGGKRGMARGRETSTYTSALTGHACCARHKAVGSVAGVSDTNFLFLSFDSHSIERENDREREKERYLPLVHCVLRAHFCALPKRNRSPPRNCLLFRSFFFNILPLSLSHSPKIKEKKNKWKKPCNHGKHGILALEKKSSRRISTNGSGILLLSFPKSNCKRQRNFLFSLLSSNPGCVDAVYMVGGARTGGFRPPALL
jgi:hypothetical protein